MGEPANIVVNVPARIPLHEAVQQLRKYDGKTDAEEYLDRFEGDIAIFQYDKLWALMNIDRVLLGDAKAWYNSVWPVYVEILKALPAGPVGETEAQKTARLAIFYDAQWNLFKNEMLLFFDHKSHKQHYRQKNREIKFSFHKDPQSYVTSKLETLRHIDTKMTNERKVEQLIRGLPSQIQQNFALQTIATPHEFLEKLRRAKEVHMSNNPENQSRASSSHNTKSSSTFVALPHPALNELKSKPRNQRTEDDKSIFNFCGRIGHIKKHCRTFARQKEQAPGDRNPNNPPREFYNQNYQKQNPAQNPPQMYDTYVPPNIQSRPFQNQYNNYPINYSRPNQNPRPFQSNTNPAPPQLLSILPNPEENVPQEN